MIGLSLSDRYRIVREVGRGGMGVVYLAEDPLLQREVAVKVIRPGLLNPEAIERFQREARVAARLDHPSIAVVHDIGQHEGSLYFVLRYIAGQHLRVLLGEANLSLGEVLEVAIQVAVALDYSHQQGVVHRDIKPENILLTRQGDGSWRARSTDFGLASASFQHSITQSGAFLGTPAYLSPEQIAAQPADQRSDIYAFGTVLYECLAGCLPFPGSTYSILYRILYEQPPSLTSRGVPLDAGLEEIILRCLAKEPARRPQSCGEVAEAIALARSRMSADTRAAAAQPVGAGRAETRPSPGRFIGREKEMAELQRRLEAALAGECQTVAVEGTPGAGKSRLLEELAHLARLRQVMVLRGRFFEQHQSPPYQCFCEIIQDYFRQQPAGDAAARNGFGSLAAELEALFPALAESEAFQSQATTVVRADPGFAGPRLEDRTKVFELIARSFALIAAGRARLVLIEDPHAGETSGDTLEYLFRRLGHKPILIVGTFHRELMGKNHPLLRLLAGFEGDRRFGRIRLEPFTPAENLAFLESLFGKGRFDREVAERIYASTEGNPYFTSELVHALMESGGIVLDQSGCWVTAGEEAWTVQSLPGTIQQLVQQRLDRLPTELQSLLATASVLGRSFDLGDLAELHGDRRAVEDAVEHYVQGGFLREERVMHGERYAFSSGILRDVVYASLLRRPKRLLHRHYAEILERRFDGRLERVYPELVHHFAMADQPEKVVLYGMRLARKSIDAFSPGRAIWAARLVLDFLGEEARDNLLLEGEARMLLAMAQRMKGDREAALRELEAAIKVFQQKQSTAHLLPALVKAAQVSWEGRMPEQTQRWADRGIELARQSGDHPHLVQLLSLSATLANLRGQNDKAQACLAELDQLTPPPFAVDEPVPAGGRLRVGFTVPARAMQPIEIRFDEEVELLACVFETLVRADAQGNLLPHLAESWEIQEGGRAFAFRLRDQVCFHDGRRLVAEHVRNSIEAGCRYIADVLPPAYTSIVGIAAFRAGGPACLEGLQCLDERTLQIRLAEPLPIYPALLTHLRTAVALPATPAVSGCSVGPGPFRLVAREDCLFRLERNNHYWRGAPPLLDSLEFATGLASEELVAGLRRGRLDLVRDLHPGDLERIIADRHPRPRMVETLKKNLHFAVLSGFSPHLSKPEVRRALGGLLPTHDLVRRTLGRFAEPAAGLIPPGILGHNQSRLSRPLPLEEARAVLQPGDGQGGLRLRAAVHPIFQEKFAALTQAIFACWAEAGVQVEPVTPTMERFLAALDGRLQTDLILVRYIADYDDPDNFCYPLFHSSVGTFRQYFHSEQLDHWIVEARTATRQGERARLYRRIEDFMLGEGYLIPLFHSVDYRLANPAVQRLNLSGTAPYANYVDVGKLPPASSVPRPTPVRGTANLPLSAALEGLDPALLVLTQEAEITQSIFETLFRAEDSFRIRPWLVDEYTVEEGGREFRFRLRRNVCFHDGRRLTARDVRFSFERLLRNPLSRNRWLLSGIRGAEEFRSGGRPDLEGFRIRGDLDFSVELSRPLSLFPTMLTHYATAILPEGTGEIGTNWREGCVGTGAFRVAAFEPGARLELEANPFYWQEGWPGCDRLVIHPGLSPAEICDGFRSGRFLLASDLRPEDVAALRGGQEFPVQYHEASTLSTCFLAFNIHQGPFADERLRHRLAEAIDVDSLTRRHLGGLAVPAHSLIPPMLLGLDPRRRDRRVRSGGKPLTVGTAATGMLHRLFDGPYAGVTEAVYELFSRFGLSPLVSPLKTGPPDTYTADIDFHLTRWVADYPDPDAIISGLLHTREGHEGHRCGLPELDALIERGRAETELAARGEIYRQAEDLIASRALLVPLFHEQQVRLARPEVKGFDSAFLGSSLFYERLSLLAGR